MRAVIVALCLISALCGPTDCGSVGSTTNCTAMDPNARCHCSDKPENQFNDGSGCSCEWGFTFDAATKSCKSSGPAPPATKSYCGTDWQDAGTCSHGACAVDSDCGDASQKCFAGITCKGAGARLVAVATVGGGEGNCTKSPAFQCARDEDPNSYCGVSNQPAAWIGDGSGCSCNWDLKWDKAGKKCVPAVVATVGGGEGNCTKSPAFQCARDEDPNSYCGVSNQPAAWIGDGSGCSCNWDLKWDKAGKKCVPAA